MTRPRTITVVLTEKEYGALAGAVALAETDWSTMADDDPDGGRGYFARERSAVLRAWRKINQAWYGTEVSS